MSFIKCPYLPGGVMGGVSCNTSLNDCKNCTFKHPWINDVRERAKKEDKRVIRLLKIYTFIESLIFMIPPMLITGILFVLPIVCIDDRQTLELFYKELLKIIGPLGLLISILVVVWYTIVWKYWSNKIKKTFELSSNNIIHNQKFIFKYSNYSVQYIGILGILICVIYIALIFIFG